MRGTKWSMGVAIAVASVLIGAAPQRASAQPVNHGRLVIRPGKGRVDPNTGSAMLSVRRWDFTLSPTTDGISPATEPVIIAIAEETFRIPAGMLKESKSGKRFSYKSRTDRGVRSFRLILNQDGTYRVRFALAGVDFSRLLLLDRPVIECMPFAVIVGNDDGFSGVKVELLKPAPSARLTIPGFCTDVPGWPWV
ncbi:MAG TPA: hypothetical protein VMS22_01465 [Candidatus Eisenbacteria bacterium]|nr:hypothetical protein [Candidatus Eisenbacteria bacterium]